MADWLSLGATALGGLLGSQAGGSSTQSSSQTRDPWAPAQPYILQNLQNEAALQKQYQQTPFNQQQIQGYSNLFGDIGNFRDNVMPGLMDFANRGMTGNYQRQTGGSVGSGGGYGGAVRPGGMVQSSQGAFGVNRGDQQGQNGLLDLNGAQNPYTKITPTQETPFANVASAPGGLLSSNGSGGNGPSFGGTPSEVSNVIGFDGFSTEAAKNAIAAGVPVAALAGLLGGITSTPTLSQAAIDREAMTQKNALDRMAAEMSAMDSYGFGSSFSGGGYGGPGTGNGNGGGSSDRGTGNQRD